MPLKGDDDDKSWGKPTKEKGMNDRVPQSRDISKQIAKAAKQRQNPSR